MTDANEITNEIREMVKIMLDGIEAAGMQILVVDTDSVWFTTN